MRPIDTATSARNAEAMKIEERVIGITARITEGLPVTNPTRFATRGVLGAILVQLATQGVRPEQVTLAHLAAALRMTPKDAETLLRSTTYAQSYPVPLEHGMAEAVVARGLPQAASLVFELIAQYTPTVLVFNLRCPRTLRAG